MSTEEKKILIKTTELIKDYPIAGTNDLRVLNGININVYEGEIVSIIGASGSGKSTLLHILGTLDTPTSGEVYYGDKNIFKESSDNLAKFRNKEIGFIFQFHHLLPEFSAIENIAIASMIGG